MCVFVCVCVYCIYIYKNDLVPKDVHKNRTKGVENKADDTLKLVVFLSGHNARKYFLKAKYKNVRFWRYLLTKVIKGHMLYIRYYNMHSSLCLQFCTSMHKIKSHY